MVKLYNVPPNSKIDVSHLGLTIKESGEYVDELDFKHIDGMYSLSYFEHNGEMVPVHLQAWTEVKVL